MPYFITDQHPDCDNWALVKEDGELVFCHPNEPAARNHMIAISLAEDLEPGGTYEGETFRSLELRELPDAYRPANSEDVPEGRACGNCIFYKEDNQNDKGLSFCSKWDDYVRGDYYCDAWEGNESYRNDPSTPAEPEEQIEGSDKNKEGSASGAGSDIEVSERTEAALRNKVKEHNEAMEEAGNPSHTRTTLGQLKAVYRRGAGAFSTSHRPGVSRAAWSMARVNAYLYLLRNGKPENSAYVTDNDLLPEGHPKSTRADESEFERRDVNLEAPAYMRAAARKGIELYEEGLAGDGVTEQTIREAKALARGNVTADKWSRIGPWIARHMSDLDAESNQPGGEGFPGPGAVAFYLWGARPTKRGAERTREYAESVTRRIEEEAEGRATGKQMSKLETRVQSTDFEVREEGDGMTFVGYAAVFDAPSEGLPFTERIQPGAFRRSLSSRNNIFMFYNHDPANVLASTRAGTLQLQEDNRGLRVEARLANTSVGRDVAELIRSKNLDSMSFGFSVPEGGDSWNTEGTERTLRSVRLGEVSIVARPAYPSTAGTATVRGLDAIAKRASVDPDALADALTKIEVGETITEEDKQIITSVVTELSPESEPEVEAESEEAKTARLDLKKKKLMAMMKELQ